MNYILQLTGIILLVFSIIIFFLPSPHWWLSIVSFVMLLGIIFAGIISDIATTASEAIVK